ncbi:MAG: hypothetical protein ACRDRL_08625, partial [Sciscionella sp.]
PIPSDRGPIFEWSQESPRGALNGGLIMALILAAFLSLKYGGFIWVTIWWWWLIIVGFSLLVARAFSNVWLAAGASWVQYGKEWVDTYTLTDVKIGAAGVNQMLRLTDFAGRKISLKLRQTQRNPALWDLVYNGILHSVVTGQADPPKGTRRILKLPDKDRTLP